MNATKQKTWVDLLGPATCADRVTGRRIERHMGGNQWKVLWSFNDPHCLDNEDMARRCFERWLDETDDMLGDEPRNGILAPRYPIPGPRVPVPCKKMAR